jgi:hypothetical protein
MEEKTVEARGDSTTAQDAAQKASADSSAAAKKPS